MNFKFPLFNFLLLAALVGCSVKPQQTTRAIKMTDAEYLAIKAEKHQQFIEKSYLRYHRKFPRVTREDYFNLVKDQPRSFCIFQKYPVTECADFGKYEYKHGRIKSAEIAYRAAVLSEEYNSKKRNIKIFGILTQLALERNDRYTAQVYISKILHLNGENKWAKNKLIDVLSSK